MTDVELAKVGPDLYDVIVQGSCAERLPACGPSYEIIGCDLSLKEDWAVTTTIKGGKIIEQISTARKLS